MTRTQLFRPRIGWQCAITRIAPARLKPLPLRGKRRPVPLVIRAARGRQPEPGLAHGARALFAFGYPVRVTHTPVR